MRSIRAILVIAVLLAAMSLPGAAADIESLVKQLASPNQVQQWGAEVELWTCGPESTPAVLTLLKDKDPKIRAAAAQAIWHIRDRKAIPALKLALKDPDETVRAQAKETLDLFDPPKPKPIPRGREPRYLQTENMSFDQLAKILVGGDREARQRAIWAIGEHKDPRRFAVAAKYLRDKDRLLAGTATGILARCKDNRFDKLLLETWQQDKDQYSVRWQERLLRYSGAVKLATIVMKSPIEWKREQAAELLCNLENPTCVDALRAATRDSSARVRELAVWGLARLGAGDSLPLIIAALNDPSEDVSRMAAVSLGKLKAREAVDPLLALLSDPNCDEFTKSAAVDSLGLIGDRKVVPTLLDCLGRRSAMIKGSAAVASGRMKVPEAFDKLVGLLKDPEYVASAAVALGELGNPKAGDALLAAAERTDESVWDATTLALAKLKDPRAFDFLSQAASEKKPGWTAALKALGVLGDPRGSDCILPYLAADIRDRENDVTLPLGQVGDQRAAKLIIGTIDRGWKEPHGSGVYCRCDLPDAVYAAEALMAIDDAEGNAYLMKCLADKNLRVINGAVRYYISQGVPGCQDLLIKSMDDGDLELAYDFIKSGNPKLAKYGLQYLKDYPDDYDDYPPNYTSDGPIWGSKVSVGRKK